MKTGLLPLILLLAACEQTPPPEELATQMTLNVVWSNPEQIAIVAAQYGDREADRLGYTVLRRSGADATCDIYVQRPTYLGQEVQELLGHELLHCIYGPWHR